MFKNGVILVLQGQFLSLSRSKQSPAENDPGYDGDIGPSTHPGPSFVHK